jgi:hypothetical protein
MVGCSRVVLGIVCSWFLSFLLSVGGRPNSLCRHHYWVHPPKTNSMLCLTFQRVCCQELFSEVTKNFTMDKLHEKGLPRTNDQYFELDVARGCARLNNQLTGKSTACDVGSNYHRPLPINFEFNWRKSFIILRDPRARIVSGYVDGLHHEGMNRTNFEKLKARMYPPSAIEKEEKEAGEHGAGEDEGLREGTVKLSNYLYASEVYANDTALLGCQTKLVLG